jgi:hypothetical protein
MILISIKKHVLRSHFTVLRSFWLCFLLSAVISCTVLPKAPTEKIRGEWGSVVIAPARFTPATNFEAFAISKTKGVGKGATIGAGMGAVQAALLAFSFGGPSAVVIAPYLAVISVPAFATGGGVLGGFSSVTVEDAKAVNAIIQKNLKALNIQTTLAELVAKSARNEVGLVLSIDKNVGPAVHKEKVDYSDQAQRGLGGVLEIATTEIGFDGAGKTLQFFMVVRARFIRTGDGEQLYDREFVYESDPYDGKKWAASNAALFEAELYRAYASIAESIVEQVFLMTTLPLETSFRDPNQKKSSFLSLMGGFGACGLAWRLPPREFCPTIFDFDMNHKEWNRFPEIATRTPTLEWEPFPRVIDQHPRYAALLNAVSNIRYDLRIWKVASDNPPQLVYERRTLTDPKHRLDQPLESGTHYFWSIRARFDVNGQTHSTRWGCYREPGYSTDKHVKMEARHSFQMLLSYQTFRDVCTLDFIPTANYYRFKTP